MHLRRALLLFAIVLGLAAIAASLSRPVDRSSDEQAQQPVVPRETTPTLEPGSALPGAVELVYDAAEEQTRRVETGQPARVLVEVDEPGQLEIPDLGLSAYGDPHTPARFEVLAFEP